MAEDFSDISDGEVVCATQLVEELYDDDATDADLLVA